MKIMTKMKKNNQTKTQTNRIKKKMKLTKIKKRILSWTTETNLTKAI